MPTSQQFLEASVNAQRAGDKAAAERLFRSYKRVQNEELELKYGRKMSPAEEDAGFIENVGTGLASGFVGTLETAALGLATMQEEEAELATRKKIKDFAERFKPEGGDEDSLAYKLATGVGSLGAFVPAAFLGKAALPAAGVIALGAGAGEASERARAAGATEEERGAASLRGAAIGATELIPLGRLAGALQIPGLPKFLDKLSGKVTPETTKGIRNKLQRMAATGVAEGAQEATAAILQNLNEMGYNPEQVLFEAGVVEEGAIGGGAGAIFQGVVDLLAPKRFDKGKEPKVEAEKTQEETQEEFDARQEAARTARGDVQQDMFADELDDAEIARLDREKAREDAERERLEDPDEVEFDMLVAEEGREQKEKEEARDQEERDKQITIDEAIEDAKDKEAKEQVRADSALETLDARRADEIRKKTRLGRRIILDEVLDGVNKTFPKGGTDANLRDYIKGEFRKKMSEEGYGDPELNRGEKQSVETYLRLKGAKPEAREMLPSDSDLSTLESQIKEKVDVTRKQADGTPDARPSRDRVQSGAESLVGQRVADTGEVKRPVERGLDDNIGDTGRPARGKKRTFTSLAEAQKQYKAQRAEEKRIERGKEPRGKVIQYLKQDLELPQVDPKTNKLRYRDSNKLITPHADSDKDAVAMMRVSGMKPAKDVGRLSQEAKKVLKKPERDRTPEEKQLLTEDQKLMRSQKDTLTDLNKVSQYFAAFNTPMDALYNAVYEVAEGGTKGKTPTDARSGKLAMYSKEDPMKPFVSSIGTKNAKKVIQWANKNLSKETRKQLNARLEEFKGKVKKELEKPLTKEELTKQAAERQARAKKVDPVAVKARQERMAADAEQRAAQKAEKVARKKKLSKEEKASIKATEEFTNTLNDPKTNPRNARTYQRLKTLAEKTDDPQTSLEALDAAVAKKIEGDVQTTTAVKGLEKTKVEKGQLKQKDVDKTNRQRGLEKAYKKFVGKKGITKLDVIAAYNKFGEAYTLKEATVEEIVEAGIQRARERGQHEKMFKIDDAISKDLETPLTEEILGYLRTQDVKRALLSLPRLLKTPQLKVVARKLADNIGDTTIVFANTADLKKAGLSAPKGRIAHGGFDAIDNTIYLNLDVINELSIETLMHEAVHAVTVATIVTKPKNKAVKELDALFKDVKDQLGTAYGVKDLKEFVAEGLSNPEFRQRLAGTRVGQLRGLKLFFRRIANLLRQVFGLDTVPTDTSKDFDMDKFEQAVMQIMEPNPDSLTIGHLEISPMVKAIKNAIDPSGREARTFVGKFADYINDKRPKASTVKGLTKIMNLQSLADLARTAAVGLGDVGQQLLVNIENQQGLLEQYSKEVKKILNGYEAFVKEYGTEAKQVLDRVIYNMEYGATIHQVDPTKPRSDYEGEFIDGNSLEEVYDEQQKQLDLLDADTRKAVLEQFTTMRNQYRKQWTRLRKALKIEFDSLAKEADAEAVKKVATKIDRVLFARGELDVYFPLVRQGKFKVSFSYRPKGGVALEKGFLMFEHLRERDAFLEDVKDNPDIPNDSIDVYDTDLEATKGYKDAPNGSFVADILTVMKDGKVSEDVQEQVLQLYVNALPETSYSRSLTRRLGTFGFIQDAKVAMESKGYSLASQSAKIESAANIRATERDILAAKKEAKNPYAKVVADTLINDHARFATSGADKKGIEEYYKRANQVAFIYTLGFNISSALVNLSQIPLFAVPMMAPRYGFDSTVKAFAKATKMVGSAKNSIIEYYNIDGEGLGATYTLSEDIKKEIYDNSGTKAEADARIKELTDIIPLVKMAHLRGKLPTADILQDVGVNERAGFLDKIAHLSAFAFQAAERFNTQTTLLASYDVALKKLKDAKESGDKYFNLVQGQDINVSSLSDADIKNMAAEEAIYNTQEVNSGSRLETAPPLSKQGIMRVALMYKTYGIQMYYSMIKASMIATGKVFETNSEQRKIARRQLAGLHLSAVLFAGVGGIPLYGLVSMIYDLFADDDEDTADEVVRKYVTELGFKGPLSTVLGADVAARVKLTDLLFQENRFMRDPSVEEMAGYYLGGPALSTGKRFLRGLSDFGEGEIQRGVESILPGGISNALVAGRYYADEGVMTRRGDYIYEDISTNEVLLKAVGFAPLAYTFQVEQNSRNKRVDQAVSKEKTKLLKKYYVALRFSDYMEMASVRKDMKEFNKKNPTNQITAESIIRSMKSHVKTSSEMYSGVTISPLMRYAIEQSNKDYTQF